MPRPIALGRPRRRRRAGRRPGRQRLVPLAPATPPSCPDKVGALLYADVPGLVDAGAASGGARSSTPTARRGEHPGRSAACSPGRRRKTAWPRPSSTCRSRAAHSSGPPAGRWYVTSGQSRPEGPCIRTARFHLHFGVGDRGPSRQDRRPDLRRRPRRGTDGRPDGPRGMRDAGHDRPRASSPARSPPTTLRRHPAASRETIMRDRLRPGELRLRRATPAASMVALDEQSPDIAQGVDDGARDAPPGDDRSTRRARATRA